MSTTIAFLDLNIPDAEIREDPDCAYHEVRDRGIFIAGPQLKAFENEYANACGSRHCTGVGNGLDALRLMLQAYGIGPGDDVIVPSNTFIPTWLAVSHVGATPMPVEPLEASYNINPARIDAAITARTRAIVPVHLYGQPTEMDEINDIARRRSLNDIEHTAQSQGAVYRSRLSGSLTDAAGHSFYPGKNLGALGDGSAITTNDDALDARLRILRSYGSTVKYDHAVIGFSSRLDELQAAFMRVKLRRLNVWNARRRAIASRYLAGLAGLPDCILPTVPPYMESAWHLFVVRTGRRSAMQEALRKQGIETGIHYPTAPHLQGADADMGFAEGRFPLSEKIHAQAVSLPMGPHLSEADADEVIYSVRAFDAQAAASA